jgi:hypothetical protein
MSARFPGAFVGKALQFGFGVVASQETLVGFSGKPTRVQPMSSIWSCQLHERPRVLGRGIP